MKYLIALLSFSLMSYAQEKPEQGKSVELSEAFIKKQKAIYKYVPVVPEYWMEVETFLKEKKYKEVLRRSEKQLSTYGEATPEGYEAVMARGLVFYNQKFIYAAFHTFMQVAEEQLGSEVGNNALYWLADIVKNHDYDKKQLNIFIDSHELKGLQPEIQNFISYFKSIHLLKFGYTNWAKEHLLIIENDSYWGHLRKYWSGIAMVARNKVDKAQLRFEELILIENLHKKIKDRVMLQLARIYFEQGLFDKAFKIYENLVAFPVREKGRALLEKAWTKFYLGDYGKAMGILHALKAPVFFPAVTPERHILEMLIYRQLCHFDSVTSSAKKFYSYFGKTISNIQNRTDLKKDKILFSMAVMDLDVQMSANLIASMREEYKKLSQKGWAKHSYYKGLRLAYRRKDRQLQMQMDRVLHERIRKAANELLKAADQVHFLDYTSTLDALKLSKDYSETYMHEHISKYKFEKLFWPIKSEYWFDEFEDYSMQISSQCLITNDKEQIKLEESFK